MSDRDEIVEAMMLAQQGIYDDGYATARACLGALIDKLRSPSQGIVDSLVSSWHGKTFEDCAKAALSALADLLDGVGPSSHA